MTPLAILSMIKDLIILVALGFGIWLLISYGKNIVRVDDMKALQRQVQQNTQAEDAWRKEMIDAEIERARDMDKVATAINNQRDPVFLMPNGSACARPLSSATAPPIRATPSGGRTDQRPGIDLRPAINAFELRYEAALAQCRADRAKWPVTP